MSSSGAASRLGSPYPVVYLDYQATTPLDARVLEFMMPYLTSEFGNAASQHYFGRRAADAVDQAREQVAAIINARPQEIVFTSGATESNNLALKGLASDPSVIRKHIVSTPTEHPSVIDCLEYLKDAGFEISYVPVDTYGVVDLDRLKAAIRKDTLLISVMAANNEIGTIAPLGEIGEIAQSAGVVFHCDATQMVGKWPLDVKALKIDLLSFSAHKLYGPKGIGALFVDRKLTGRLVPLMHGGGHERGTRSGTMNVAGSVGFGEACRLAQADLSNEIHRMALLRDELHERIGTKLDGVYLNGHPTKRIPTNLNLRFDGVDADALMLALPELAVSSGSACSSASPAPSHVLLALGLSYEESQQAIRFGVGRFTSVEDVEFAATRVVSAVETLRSLFAGTRAINAIASTR